MGRRLSEEKFDNIRRRYEQGEDYEKIAAEVECALNTIRKYVCAFNTGFESLAEYADKGVQDREFFNYVRRYKEPRRKQKKFEASMETRGLPRRFQEGNGHLGYDCDIGVEEALKILARKHYIGGRVVYDHRNPNGAIEARVIWGIYYEGKKLEELGREMGVTKARAGQIKDKGLEHLHDILTKPEFR